MQKIYLSFLLALCLFAPNLSLAAATGSGQPDYIYNLNGTRGIILCFHGHGGSGSSWAEKNYGYKAYLDSMVTKGYGYVCPSSLDRNEAKWSGANNASNPDVKNVDDILDQLKVSSETPLYLIGHSNGGGFVSRYAVFSNRAKQIVAAQYQNASGIPQILADNSYTTPTIIMGATCDRIVPYSKIEKSMSILGRKNPPIEHRFVELDQYYTPGTSCHAFVPQSAEAAAAFFGEVASPGASHPSESENGEKTGKRRKVLNYIYRNF